MVSGPRICPPTSGPDPRPINAVTPSRHPSLPAAGSVARPAPSSASPGNPPFRRWGSALPHQVRSALRAGHWSVGGRRWEAGRILRVAAQLVDEQCQFGDVSFVGGLLDQVEHFLDTSLNDRVCGEPTQVGGDSLRPRREARIDSEVPVSGPAHAILLHGRTKKSQNKVHSARKCADNAPPRTRANVSTQRSTPAANCSSGKGGSFGGRG